MDEKDDKNPSDHSEDRTELHQVELPATAFPCLEVIAGPRTGYRFPLKEGESNLGRSKTNEVVLDDSSVSRKHATFIVKAGQIVLKDAGSRNGTRFQGEKIEHEVICPQQSRVKVGIYEFQVLHEEPKGPPPEIPSPEEMSVRAAKAKDPSRELPPPEDADGSTEMVQADFPIEAPVAAEGEDEVSVPASRKWITLGGVGLIIILVAVAGAMVAKKFIFKKSPSQVATDVASTDKGEKKEPGVGKTAAGDKAKEEAPQSVPVFINFTSSPIPAEVYFGKQKLGMTPHRQSTNLELNKTYEGRAVFLLPQVGEALDEKIQFKLKEGSQIVPVHFKGDIALIKVSTMPRDTQLYLEGYFDKDPYKARPIKFDDIVFGKPIYVPYGRYVLELRQNKRLAHSQTFIDEVVYRREFQLSSDMTNFTINVSEKDLKIFPAEIRSVPSGADVFIDDAAVGKTPYQGTLPLGDHVLLVKRDGYFDYTQPIQVKLNAPYVSEIKLQTSEAGQFINQAKNKINLKRYQEALNDLVEALKRNPSPEETGECNYLIGFTSLLLKRYQDAMDHFVKAMEVPAYLYAARLGVAQIYFGQEDKVKSLQLLIEVLIGSEDKNVRADAASLFQQISPYKSVIYINSEPKGASVMVNGVEIDQKTPTILYELGVGTYRVVIQQVGYRPYEQKINLAVSEFKPIFTKLEPLALE